MKTRHRCAGPPCEKGTAKADTYPSDELASRKISCNPNGAARVEFAIGSDCRSRSNPANVDRFIEVLNCFRTLEEPPSSRSAFPLNVMPLCMDTRPVDLPSRSALHPSHPVLAPDRMSLSGFWSTESIWNKAPLESTCSSDTTSDPLTNLKSPLPSAETSKRAPSMLCKGLPSKTWRPEAKCNWSSSCKSRRAKTASGDSNAAFMGANTVSGPLALRNDVKPAFRTADRNILRRSSAATASSNVLPRSSTKVSRRTKRTFLPACISPACRHTAAEGRAHKHQKTARRA
mmetsp:Transcript_52265/g.122059  ORF Transcript_52265/g.122059 Transcript_52265/m.122059 type:complete len:288 (-) Transcript_52265:9-872(-)